MNFHVRVTLKACNNKFCQHALISIHFDTKFHHVNFKLAEKNVRIAYTLEKK